MNTSLVKQLCAFTFVILISTTTQAMLRSAQGLKEVSLKYRTIRVLSTQPGSAVIQNDLIKQSAQYKNQHASELLIDQVSKKKYELNQKKLEKIYNDSHLKLCRSTAAVSLSATALLCYLTGDMSFHPLVIMPSILGFGGLMGAHTSSTQRKIINEEIAQLEEALKDMEEPSKETNN